MRRTTKTAITAQKKSLHAEERESERVGNRRVEYEREVKAEILSKFKFLDEAGSNLAMTRLYGRGARGARVIETVPQNYGENITMLATLSVAGITAPMTINGAVDGDVFKVYVEQVLCPTLETGDVVVMDNLPAFERCWSKSKTYLRRAKARTREELEKALREALLLITKEDAQGWFRSCGYAIH